MGKEDKWKEIKHKPYTMTYHCPNCHQDFIETFEFGEVASQGICPHCGVSPSQTRYPRYRRDDVTLKMKVEKK